MISIRPGAASLASVECAAMEGPTLRRRLLHWLWAPDRELDSQFRAERDWVAQFNSDLHHRHGSLLLEYARRKYDEAVQRRTVITDKLGETIRVSSSLAVLLVAAVKGFDVEPTLAMKAALICFLLSAIVSVWARRALVHASPASTRSVILGAQRVDAAETWLAASLYETDQALRVVEDWCGHRLTIASVLLVMGIGLLAFSFLFFQ